MNETYEKVCSAVNWRKDINIDETKISLMETFSRKELDEAESYANKLLSKLHKSGITDLLFDHQGYYGDGVHDCMCHMVAFGERVVTMYLEKPELAVKLLESEEYVENFLYVLPSETDYKMRDYSYFENRVKEELEELDEIKSSLLFKYNPQFLESEGGYDCDMAQTVLEEIGSGFKNDARTYNEIWQSTKNLGNGALYANLWKDFLTFCVIPEKV